MNTQAILLERTSAEPVHEAVWLSLPSRRSRYLVHAMKEACHTCDTGTRVSSIWATERGMGEEISWCGHCFNAWCERRALKGEIRARFEAVLAAVAQGRISRPWTAVRPALEDLERRGLL